MPHRGVQRAAMTPTAATTLHITVLSSHYAGHAEGDEAAVAPGTAAGHKKDAGTAKGSAASAAATSKAVEKERESYSGGNAADQQDSIARGLRAALQERCSTASGRLTAANCDRIAASARRVQLAKAVRDGAIPLTEVPLMFVEEGLDSLARTHPTALADSRPRLSTSSLLSDAAAGTAAGAKPASRSSSRGRGGAGRQRASSASSRRVSALSAVLQSLTEADRHYCQTFLDGQLPACEVVSVPVAEEGEAAAQSCPVFFLYRVAQEEEVVAALAALPGGGSAETASGDAGPFAAERERRRQRASRAAALVTRAVWCALRPVLRSYLHSVKATRVPSQIAVVWSVADPRLLEGLSSHTAASPAGGVTFWPCPAAPPPRVSADEGGEGAALAADEVDRWVRLVPRSAVYLYDPVATTLPSSDPAAAAVEAALAAIANDRADRQRSVAEAESTKAKNRHNSGESTSTKAGGKAAGSRAGPPAIKGRGAAGRGEGAAAAAAAMAAAGNSATVNAGDHAGGMTVEDFNAEPSLFPYSTADATSLACYLVSSGDSAASKAAATPPREERQRALTLFLGKAAAHRRAVLAQGTHAAAAEHTRAKSALRVTADLLCWVHRFLRALSVAEEGTPDAGAKPAAQPAVRSWPLVEEAGVSRGAETGVATATLDSVVAASLARSGLDPDVWPLPLWAIAAVPVAALPPLLLRGGGDGETPVPQPDGGDHGAFKTWAAVWRADGSSAAAAQHDAALLLRQLARTGRLAAAYAAWTMQTTVAKPPNSVSAGLGQQAGRQPEFGPDAFTGGIFTVLNSTAALVAEASRARGRERASATLRAHRAVDEGSANSAADASAADSATLSASSPPQPTLFRRYAQPFQKLAPAQDSAVDVATVPRNTAPSAADGEVAQHVTVAVADNTLSADVCLPPYPQEVVAMVRQMIAKNAGHFEVNVMRGTDTLTAAHATAASSAMVDSTMTGSFLPSTRQAALSTTTQSTGLLLRQQQQQQRRRQRGQGGSVAATMRPYMHGVRLVKEVAKASLGRRPLAEAAVLLQVTLEATLAGVSRKESVAPRSSARRGSAVAAQGKDGGASSVATNALSLLQRYLVRHRATASARDREVAVAEAASSAAQSLTPRVYEHCLQQALLHQLLCERDLEHGPQPADAKADGTAQDWCVTEHVPTEAIVSAMVSYQERFGAHNVRVHACALEYHLESPPPAAEKAGTSAGSTSSGGGKKGTAGRGVLDAGEAHQTSAYAHNALNVHPTRRAAQLWVVGVAMPAAQPVGGGASKGSPGPLSAPRRTRKWVEMVPRAGAVTPMELYALWRTMLRARGDTADRASSSPSALPTGSTRHDDGGVPLRAALQLLTQYVESSAEVSTALVQRAGPAASASPMRFGTHETLFPHGDAVLEVWAGEGQRSCRYIRATEVTAALHAGTRAPHHATAPLHLSVHWDDGLLFTCGTAGDQQSTLVPSIDVAVTAASFVLQRRVGDSRLVLRRYANTSAGATAASVAAAQERSGQPSLHGPPQGLLGEVCAQLLERRTTLCCVHDWPPRVAAAGVAEATLEPTVEEAEVLCEVDERTGVVRRTFPSGAELLQCPSGAMLTRWPLQGGGAAPGWCETLVTCDGRCFVRRSGTATFCRVTPRQCGGSQGLAFEQSESTFDTVRHCHVRSRRDGLTVLQYTAITDSTAPQSSVSVARVVVFPDGTSITTLADRTVRRRVLAGGDTPAAWTSESVRAAVALASPSLCAMLEEVAAVEGTLLGASTASEESMNAAAHQSVQWLIEAPTLPRFYLAPAAVQDRAAFAVVLGDGTVLQRHWVAAAAAGDGGSGASGSPLPTPPMGSISSASWVVGGSVPQLSGDQDGPGFRTGDPFASAAPTPPPPAYDGGTVATVLVRPSTSAVRVLHRHALVTVEPADVLRAVTRATPAAYAVGQGLPFFDLAHGGGVRLVDAGRCVWEVRSLAAAAAAPKVSRPDRPRSYEALLRELVSAHYSPHRVPRAAELASAQEQLSEEQAYARQRAAGWCPPLVRRLRELVEPFVRAAHLLRSDVLAPVESAAMKGGHAHRAASIRPACFGQLANGEAVRYWCAHDVLPPTASAATAVASEPHVLQRLVPSMAVGSVLQYPCGAPASASAAEVMAALSSGGRGAVATDGSVLGQRLAEAQRLSLLCVGGLAPAIPPALAAAASSASVFAAPHADALPPLAVLTSLGCRWMPPSLQPPQQFSSAHSKSAVHAVAAQSDVVWSPDAAATAAPLASGSVYVQYLMDKVEPGIPAVALRTAVARRELHRHEELAQLSHYHRVLTAQWPMVPPASAGEEQVRLEARYDELQRAHRRPAAPSHASGEMPFAPAAPTNATAASRTHGNARLTA